LSFTATGGDLAALFNSGAVQIGLHIQSVGTTGESESLVSTASPAPEPTAPLLFGGGVVLAALLRKRIIV
jgi:hypothetical protein